MTDVNRVITLGIGPGSDLAGFLTVGLNINPTFTGVMTNATARRRLSALEVDTRQTVYLPSRIPLEDGTPYYWTFEDDTYIMWEAGDVGAGRDVKRRLGNMKVKRNG